MAIAQIDFGTIVNRAADQVERDDSVIIEMLARELLIRRAEDHSEDVRIALQSQGLSVADLEYAAAAQFREATPTTTPTGRYILAPAVEAGMRRRCHFVPWC